MKIKLLLLSLLIVSILSSCVTPRDTNLIQENVRKDYVTDATLGMDYRIIPGDRLALSIYTLDENMKTLFSMYIQRLDPSNNATGQQAGGNVLNVYSDGTIRIPYLSKISVLDLTVMEAKKLIESKFQEFSPNITVELALQNRYFSMLGTQSGGRISMPSPRINIYQALALGGTIDPFGDRRKVSVIRQTPNGTEVKTFDLRSKDIINSEFYFIQPNDVIYVQELSRTFFGRITSFTGLLGGLGILTSTVAVVVLIVNLTK